MSATIKYKGNTIAVLNTDTSKTCETAGKYCEDNIIIENVQDGGTTPSGTIDIADNGTYDVTDKASASVAVRNGTNNRHYETTNPSTVVSYGNYVVIATDPILATVRSYTSLSIRIVGPGTLLDTCTKSTYASNSSVRGVIVNGVPRFIATNRCTGSETGATMNKVDYPVDNDTNISSGSGRIYITEDGELRWYSNTSGFPILAGDIIADVFWGNE